MRAGPFFVAWAQRWVPDPFVFAVLLTFAALALGLAFTDSGLLQMVDHWSRGFWELLAFSMQMCLILITGHALASTALVRRWLGYLARLPRTPRQAVALVALTASAAAWVNWGLGLIAGALLARDVGRRAEARGIRVHYPLLGAAGYTGLLVWHGGWSGSAPLTVSTPGHFLEGSMGVVSVADTLLAPMNLLVTAVLLALVPALCAGLHPPEEAVRTAGAFLPPLGSPDREAPDNTTPARWLETTPLLPMTIASAGLFWILRRFSQAWAEHHSWGAALGVLDLNTINFLFLFAGLLLHGSLRNYAEAVGEGVKGAAGIILQFPFYAGIMGMIQYSGLVGEMAGWFVAVSRWAEAALHLQVFPVLAFLSAGLVNLFVPSGGGQWAVQGPVMVEAAARMSLPLPPIVMAVAYGDEWTNMLQPFWALPLLGITGLEARDLIGYTIPLLLISAPVFMGALLFF